MNGLCEGHSDSFCVGSLLVHERRHISGCHLSAETSDSRKCVCVRGRIVYRPICLVLTSMSSITGRLLLCINLRYYCNRKERKPNVNNINQKDKKKSLTTRLKISSQKHFDFLFRHEIKFNGLDSTFIVTLYIYLL